MYPSKKISFGGKLTRRADQQNGINHVFIFSPITKHDK
jgi:hypothetical protein